MLHHGTCADKYTNTECIVMQTVKPLIPSPSVSMSGVVPIVKAYERAAMWGDEPGAPNPGLPPGAMLMLFAIVFTIIVVLAALKFVNETLPKTSFPTSKEQQEHFLE
eukprot:scaffold8749_cov115-Skeletonema_dohrnii-CCMP3373.AAC.2